MCFRCAHSQSRYCSGGEFQYCAARTGVESVSALVVTKVGLFISCRFGDCGSVPHYLKKTHTQKKTPNPTTFKEEKYHNNHMETLL